MKFFCFSIIIKWWFLPFSFHTVSTFSDNILFLVILSMMFFLFAFFYFEAGLRRLFYSHSLAHLILYNSMIFCLSKLHFGSPCSYISSILHLRIFCCLQAAQMSSTLFQIKQSPQVLEKVLEKVAEVWYECFWECFI